MSAHTPGPWQVEKGRDKTHPYSVTGDGFDLARCVTVDDAALIAAAPDMLEALRRFRHARDHWAEHGVFPPEYGIEADQCYDDWVADIADTILTKLEGGAA
jgi:hypothetical protein